MGSESCKAVSADPELELVGTSDSRDNLQSVLADLKPEVVVDFTVPHCAVKNTEIILNASARPVIGTTGFKEEDIKRLKALAKERQIGGLIAPNFAIGVVLMMKLAPEISKYMPDVEIIELHHENKLDAPSGTAVRTAELILEAQPQAGAVNHPQNTVELYAGARGAKIGNIHVHSVRLPGLVAHQEIIFGGKGQTLRISHDSLNRESFMPGVCLACKKVPDINELLVGLEHLL